MKTLLRTAIILLIFTGTILSGNPKLICFMMQNDNICPKQIIEKPKSCSSCKMEKEIEQSCTPTSKSPDCNFSATTQLKKCCKCLFAQPIRSAVLSQQKPAINLKTIARFNQTSFNTSKKHINDFSKLSIPIGIHRTISSTILRL